MEERDDSVHFSLPPTVFYLLLAAAGLGGAGGYGVLAPKIEEAAIQKCFDNSSTAISVSAQHGEELNEIRRLLYERTIERWTSSDQAKFQLELDKRLSLIERQMTHLEREADQRDH